MHYRHQTEHSKDQQALQGHNPRRRGLPQTLAALFNSLPSQPRKQALPCTGIRHRGAWKGGIIQGKIDQFTLPLLQWIEGGGERGQTRDAEMTSSKNPMP